MSCFWPVEKPVAAFAHRLGEPLGQGLDEIEQVDSLGGLG